VDEPRGVGRGRTPRLDVDRKSSSPPPASPYPPAPLAVGLRVSVRSPPPAAAFLPINSVFSVTTNPLSAELSTDSTATNGVQLNAERHYLGKDKGVEQCLAKVNGV